MLPDDASNPIAASGPDSPGRGPLFPMTSLERKTAEFLPILAWLPHHRRNGLRGDVVCLVLTSSYRLSLTVLARGRHVGRRSWPPPGRYAPSERRAAGALQAGGLALRRDGQGELAGRLVDHLAVQHDRAAPVHRSGLLVRIQDPHRALVVIG